MFKALLYLGLCVTPFIFYAGCDIRDIKMTAAVICAMALSAAGFYLYGLKRFPNKWVLMLLAYIPISIFFSPHPEIKLIGIDVSYFWSWEPFVQILLFCLLGMSVASYEFKDGEIDTTLSIMAWCGGLTAAYMILQFFFMDQFFAAVPSFIEGRGQVAGFIGNPTLTAPFVGMLIPLAIYCRKWPMACLMGIAVWLTQSQIGYGAVFISLLFLLATKGPRRFCISVIIAFIALLCILWNFSATANDRSKTFFQEDGRFERWVEIAKDLKNPIVQDQKNSYPLTGHGIGSFKFVYHVQHPGTETNPNRFFQAHSDPLELTYCLGFAGLFFFIMSIYWIFKRHLNIFQFFNRTFDRRRAALLSSFICILLSSCGTFALQIGTIAYFTAVLVGLLHNEAV